MFESYLLEAYETIRSILSMMDCHGEPQSLIEYFNQVIHVGRKQFAAYAVRATPVMKDVSDPQSQRRTTHLC